MIHPSDPALRTRGVGPVSVAIQPRPASERTHEGQTEHRAAASDGKDRRASAAQRRGPRSSAHQLTKT